MNSTRSWRVGTWCIVMLCLCASAPVVQQEPTQPPALNQLDNNCFVATAVQLLLSARRFSEALYEESKDPQVGSTAVGIAQEGEQLKSLFNAVLSGAPGARVRDLWRTLSGSMCARFAIPGMGRGGDPSVTLTSLLSAFEYRDIGGIRVEFTRDLFGIERTALRTNERTIEYIVPVYERLARDTVLDGARIQSFFTTDRFSYRPVATRQQYLIFTFAEGSRLAPVEHVAFVVPGDQTQRAVRYRLQGIIVEQDALHVTCLVRWPYGSDTQSWWFCDTMGARVERIVGDDVRAWFAAHPTADMSVALYEYGGIVQDVQSDTAIAQTLHSLACDVRALVQRVS